MGGPEKKGESDKEQKNKLFRHKTKQVSLGVQDG